MPGGCAIYDPVASSYRLVPSKALFKSNENYSSEPMRDKEIFFF